MRRTDRHGWQARSARVRAAGLLAAAALGAVSLASPRGPGGSRGAASARPVPGVREAATASETGAPSLHPRSSPRKALRAVRTRATPSAYRNHTGDLGSGRYGSWSVQCSTCHTVHWGRTTNVRLIREIIETPNSGAKRVYFTFDDVEGNTNPGDRPEDFPDHLGYLGDRSGPENAPYDDGICEVCHTRTAHHRNDTSGGDHTHYAAYRCVVCHRHSQGFMVNEQDCLSCHSLALGNRRPVARDFARTDSHPLAYDRTALTDPDHNNCLICHEERAGAANHRDGAVNWSPDPDRSGAAEWQGIHESWWCLDCHDPTTPGHLGGRTAPDMTSYYSSTHVTTPSPGAPLLCGFCHLGDPQYPYQEEYYPFHGNAHAPATGNVAFFSSDPARPRVARGEENVCLECHGGFTNVRRYDDPGCTDGRSYMENLAATMRGIAAGTVFRIVSRHYPTDPTDGVNDCRRCHDPHRIDRYAGRMIFDPDDPTVPWDWNGTGTTPDGFCLRCHDGTQAAPPVHAGVPLGGKRCLECHTVHGSTNPSLQYLTEGEIAAVSVAVTPVTPTVAAGATLPFSATVSGLPPDRRIGPVWTVSTQSGGSAPREYPSSDGPFSIPDPAAFTEEGGVVSTIVVPDSFTVLDLNVRVDVSHPSAYDLSIILEHADSGRRILLKADTCFFCGAYTPTWYDEEGTVPGSEPGLERLDTFYGENAHGTWRLYVTDHWPGDAGTFDGWTLSFNGGIVGTIDQTGLFTAIAPGTALVRAAIHSGRIRLVDPCGSWWNLTETEAADATLVTVTGPVTVSRAPESPVGPRAPGSGPGRHPDLHPPGADVPPPVRSGPVPSRCRACHARGLPSRSAHLLSP